MNKQVQDLVGDLKSQAESLLSLLMQDAERAPLQQNALALFTKIIELKKEIGFLEQQGASLPKDPVEDLLKGPSEDDLKSKEINKVNRKLPKWAANQHQINSKILTKYLELRRAGKTPLTEREFASAYGDKTEFHKNYPQMKTISPKNNGKIFDVRNGMVVIWEPVVDAVGRYESTVFDNS